MYQPPDTFSASPVMKPARRSEARNITASTTSSERP